VSFLDDEASVEANQPREGYEITLPNGVFRLASGGRNVLIQGNVYLASPIRRGELRSIAGEDETLEVTLPITHPICQRYLQGGVPPKSVFVTVWRKQLRSGEAEMVRSGYADSMSVNVAEHTGTLHVRSLLDDASEIKLPNETTGRECPHVLYGPNCKVNSALHRTITTATAVDGPFLTLASDGGLPDHALANGFLFHPDSNESMTILAHLGNDITLQLPIVELQSGATVHVFRGCDHTIEVCDSIFANKRRFGGSALMPRGNPFLPTGYGIYTSE
jgi:hypothetical protein